MTLLIKLLESVLLYYQAAIFVISVSMSHNESQYHQYQRSYPLTHPVRSHQNFAYECCMNWKKKLISQLRQLFYEDHYGTVYRTALSA